MGKRIDHLRESKKYTEDLMGKSGFDVMGFRWKSWIRHPIGNFRYHFWNNVPHSPKMEIEVASVGSVDHEYRDADVIYLSNVCQRCSFHVNEGTFVPWRYDDQIIIKNDELFDRLSQETNDEKE